LGVKDIALLSWKSLKSMPLAKDCKGIILAARIYSDTAGYKCQCGGVYNKRIEHSDHSGLMVPKCNQCSTYPPVFHIDADAFDPNGNKIRVKIRNDQNNNRLTNISQVIFTLQTIQKEIMAGEFDVSRYVSKDARESFRFKNYIAHYLILQERRLLKKEITPKALRDKKSLINNHLVPEFGGLDLAQITRQRISSYIDTLVERKRVHNLAIGELRTILRQAEKDEKIKIAPRFDPIPKAEKRHEIISMELIHKTIEAMPIKLYRDMFTLMTIYPLRPSEVRALRWKDFSPIGKTMLFVRGHFSDEVWIDGRKSIAEGDKSTMKYDRSERAMAILSDYRASAIRGLDPETDWIFKGINGTHVQDEALADAWRSARSNMKNKDDNHKHQLYEIRHRCLTEFGKRVSGDIMKMTAFSGHKNANTLMERYIRDDSDLSEYIQ
jgi:integrase